MEDLFYKHDQFKKYVKSVKNRLTPLDLMKLYLISGFFHCKTNPVQDKLNCGYPLQLQTITCLLSNPSRPVTR